MNYEQWRNELFGQSPNIDPVMFEHSAGFYSIPSECVFDYVDRVLVDPDVHSLFNKTQLGNGIQTVYSNCCSDLPFLYTTECTESRRIEGIGKLANLYTNYFERYCAEPVNSIGNDQGGGPMGYICYMFWDVFVLYPGSATPGMVSAALEVMRAGLETHSDNCLVSAIHGLGHWAAEVPGAVTALEHWLRSPTTKNVEVLEYARTATTGMIQ
jgi:hypothetical protein